MVKILSLKALTYILSIVILQCHFTISLKFVSHKDCNNVRKGTFVAHPSNCNQYIQCDGLRSTLGTCPEGTYFNAEVLSCDSSNSVCKKKEPTTEESTDPQVNNIEPTSSSTDRPLCTSWFDQQFPHPHNCQYYYYCVKGFLTIRRCHIGFGWDFELQKCVSMQDAKCFKS
ncbi:peritrophin-44-like [Teleopsis dalmanni]|uniref:peritrophin-44-like n=1 Tax=Teleopsis dalmanni TaxID=139649 RepID=UPI0018CE2A9F|nr:peritrophin-44-like [Teleopsis dalmanni]